jgi:DNA repair exonuclease SbcCD ATPase subunit
MFKEGQLSLIKGPSGVGKSSIPEAITWALYGRVRSIKNKNAEKQLYYVEITFPTFIIYRQGNPKLLKYFCIANMGAKGNTYQDEVAQSMITNIFGNEKLWYSCSYIEQNNRCPLLYGSNTERMALLNTLSFWLDNPDKYIDKIDEEIKLKNTEFQAIQAVYTNQVNILSNDIKNKPIGIEYIKKILDKYNLGDNITTSDIDNMIGIKRVLLAELFTELNLQNQLKGVLTMINSKLDTYKIKLESHQGINYTSFIKNISVKISDLEEDISTFNTAMKNKDIELNIIKNTTTDNFNTFNSLLKEKDTLSKKYREYNEKNDIYTVGISKLLMDINIFKKINGFKINDKFDDYAEVYRELKSRYDNFQKIISDIHVEYKNKENIIATSKNNILNNINKKIKLVSKKESNINQLNLYNNKINEYNNELIKFGEMYTEIGSGNKINDIENFNYMEHDIWKSKENEMEILKYTKICNELKVGYTTEEINKYKDAVNEKIKELETIIKDININKEINLLLGKINELGPLIEVSDDDIYKQTNEYNELLKYENTLNCPHCNKLVKYINGKLIIENGTNISKDDIKISFEKLRCLKEQRIKGINKNELLSQINILKLKLNGNGNYDGNYDENNIEVIIKQCKDLINLLDSIKIIKLGIHTSNEIEYIIKYNKAKKDIIEYKKKETEITNYINLKSIITSELSDINTELISFDALNLDTEYYTLELENLNKEYKDELEKLMIMSAHAWELCDVITQYNSKYVYYKNQESEISTLKDNMGSINKELVDINLKLSNLSKLDMNTDKVNVSIKENIEWYSTKINESIKVLNMKKEELSILNHNYTLYLNTLRDVEDYTSQLKEINGKFNENILTDYTNTETYLKDLIKLKEELIYKVEVEKRKKNTVDVYDNILKMFNELKNLNLLKKSAYDLQCEQLQSTVNTINGTLNSILRDIFDQPIRVVLKLYRENKVSDRLVAAVNFSVLYQGIEYDNINNLSGGEKDRVSLALTLALSSVNGSPFLFLDETMASLDGELREMCIHSIRNCMRNNKTVIVIDHESVQGSFDDVLILS